MEELACDIHYGEFDDLVSMSPDGSGCDLVCWVCEVIPRKEPEEQIKELNSIVEYLVRRNNGKEDMEKWVYI